MSITGFAAKPGIDVEPTCSIRTADSPRTCLMFAASAANAEGQLASYGAIVITYEPFGTSALSHLTVTLIGRGRATRAPGPVERGVRHPPSRHEHPPVLS